MNKAVKPSATMSVKGQVVIPKDLRQAYGLDAGAKVEFERTARGLLMKRASPFAPTEIGSAFGILKRPGQKPLSIEDMDAAIAAEARERARN